MTAGSIDINHYIPVVLQEELRKSFLGRFLYTPKVPSSGTSKGGARSSFCTSDTSELSDSDHPLQEDSIKAMDLADQRERTTPVSARRHSRSTRSARSLSMIQHDKHEKAGGEQREEDLVTLHSFAHVVEDKPTMEDKGWNMRVDCLLPDDFSSHCQHQRTKKSSDILGNSIRSDNSSKHSKGSSCRKEFEHQSDSSRRGSKAASLSSHNSNHIRRRHRLRRSTTHDARHNSTFKRDSRPSAASSPRWSSMTKLETIAASPRRNSDNIPKAPSRKSHRQDSAAISVDGNSDNVPAVIMMPPIYNEGGSNQQKIAWRRTNPSFRRESSYKKKSNRAMTGILAIIDNVDEAEDKRKAKRSSVSTNRHNTQSDTWDSFGNESESHILVSMAW